jgi:sialate O-acetylesterase
LASAAGVAHADVTLPKVLSDGMVLQRNAPIKIWGKAAPSETVTVFLGGNQRTVNADEAGEWEVTLPSMSAGGPHMLLVRGKNAVTVKDVLVGEVWVCSGQSNMEWAMAWQVVGAEEEAKKADPQLRMFNVQKAISPTLKDDVEGAWLPAGPENTMKFSAVGYFFAKKLRAALGVPVGMLHTSWGGTRIEAWTERKTNLALGMNLREYTQQESANNSLDGAKQRWRKAREAWQKAGSPTGAFVDPGRSPQTIGWEKPDVDDSDWKPVAVPGPWEESGAEGLAGVDGGVWLRRWVTVSAETAAKETTLSLGAIDDTDVTFVNGILVGATAEETPESWQVKRLYKVPKGTLKPGKNLIAIRVWDGQGGGGLVGAASDLFLKEDLTVEGRASQKFPLTGEWRYRPEVTRPADPGSEPTGLGANAASVLYNAMLYPLRNYVVQGGIWYQGESNAGNAALYRQQLPAMVENWRRIFENPKMAFYAVQLAPWQKINPQPEDTGWARLREAQLQAMTVTKDCGLAVITDVGDEQDIHPRKKGPVGERLALIALKNRYRVKGTVAAGPTLKKATPRGATLELSFANAEGGLVAAATDSAGKTVEAGKLVGFAIAGDDGKFVWADAKIVGKDRIVLSASGVTAPRQVRFGWANFPVVNLFNAHGLPASPFRTDTK